MQFIFEQNMITALFPLVSSPTFGQLGRPLPEEPFFTLSNGTVFWQSHLTCSYVRYVFPNSLGVSFSFSGVDLQ